jgi:DnaK suppressor protein
MEEKEARSLLRAERERLEALLRDNAADGQVDRDGADQPGDLTDSAPDLVDQVYDDDVAAGLREHLAAVERAEKRLDEGTYGFSIRSGVAIPDDRLRADPSAELTVAEAAES